MSDDHISSTAAPDRPRRILVAEDNAMNQKVILRQLMLLGFEADMTGNGREALLRWERGQYGLLLSDLHMPYMDGFELTAAIRDIEQTGSTHLPIFALTANAMQGEARRCREAGMDGYLSKPLQLGDLKNLLQLWLPTVSASVPAAGNDALHASGEAPVDVRVLEALVGEDPLVIRELLSHFQASANQIAGLLGQHCAQRQSLLVSEQAHKLGSAARAAGALELGMCCAELEVAGASGDTDNLARLWLSFEHELQAVNGFLDALQRGSEGQSGTAADGGPLVDHAGTANS